MNTLIDYMAIVNSIINLDTKSLAEKQSCGVLSSSATWHHNCSVCLFKCAEKKERKKTAR